MRPFALMLTDSRFRELAIDAVLLLLLAVIAAEYALSYNIFLQAIPQDTTYHIYAAQQILDGHAIYRDVAIIKAPLADFVTAFALAFGRGAGVSDIMSARLMSLLTVIGTVLVTYWAGRDLFRSRVVGLIAGLLMAGWDFYGLRAVTGPEPKAFLILFTMPAFVFISKRRWFAAGLCAALATLSWQPGLMLAALAAAAAVIAPWLENARPSRAQLWRAGLTQGLRVAGGFAVPFAFVAAYLLWNNALTPAWNATIGANLTHFNNEQARTPFLQIVRDNVEEIFLTDARYCYSPQENWLWLTGVFGFAGIVAVQLRDALRAKRASVDLERTPLILYTLGFIAFSLVDFDFCPDLFPLLPIVAICTGWLVLQLTRAASAAILKLFPRWRARVVQGALAGVIVLALFYVYVWDVSAYTVSGTNFQDQMYAVEIARKYLEPGDTVLSFGNAIILVELQMPNASKIIHLGSKSGQGVLAFEPGGIQGMVYDLDRKPPKLITLARDKQLDWAAPFYAWLDEFYEPADVLPRAGIKFYVRKP